jgi:hypothetical protein
MKNKINSAKFLGYDIRITYDDYSIHEVLLQDLKELKNICQSLENCDDTFEVEYKKRYQLEDGSFVYSKKEHISIDNPTIPQRELLLRKFNKIAQSIYNSTDVLDEDIQKCYEILSSLMVLNKSNKILKNENHEKVHQLTINVSDEVYEHLIYFLKDMEGVEIIKDSYTEETIRP